MLGSVCFISSRLVLFFLQAVYLHTTSVDPGILIVFEVILTCVDVAGVKSEVSMGWTAQKLVKPGTKIVDLSEGTPASAAQ